MGELTGQMCYKLHRDIFPFMYLFTHTGACALHLDILTKSLCCATTGSCLHIITNPFYNKHTHKEN